MPLDTVTRGGRLDSLSELDAARKDVPEAEELLRPSVRASVEANPSRDEKEIPMNRWVRSWIAGGIAALALTAIPEMFAIVQPSGVANADVCASVGYRVSVSGCTNVADTVNTYVPPPADYAPLPQDFPPPPPPPPVSVCVGAGRRIHVSGCS